MADFGCLVGIKGAELTLFNVELSRFELTVQVSVALDVRLELDVTLELRASHVTRLPLRLHCDVLLPFSGVELALHSMLLTEELDSASEENEFLKTVSWWS